MQTNHANPDTFHNTTLLDSNYYYRAKNNNAPPPDIRTIVAIAAGYNLGLYVTEELLKLAGYYFNPTSKEHDSFIFLITSMYEYDINGKNEMLKQDGIKPFGSKPNKDKTKGKPV